MFGTGYRQSEADIARELVRAKRMATRELSKVEGELIETFGAIEEYMHKHPRQAAAITLSLGAALGAAGAFIFRQKK